MTAYAAPATRPAPSPLPLLLMLLAIAAVAVGVVINQQYSHAHASDAEAVTRCFNNSPTAQKAMFKTTEPDRFLHVCVEPGQGVFFQILDKMSDGKLWERTAYRRARWTNWEQVLKYITDKRYEYLGAY